jgi:predicted nuclease of predicted toxin-antitoxin system
VRFLAVECLDGRLVAVLQGQGFDVASVRDLCRGASDRQVLELALRERRVLLTEDKDFGELALRAGSTTPGVVLFRDLGLSIDEGWAAFQSLLARHAAGLDRSFAVIRGRRIRLRRVPASADLSRDPRQPKPP